MDEPTIESARQFVRDALAGFVTDPPDTDVQQGYLEALYVFANEALGMALPDLNHPIQTKPPATRPSHLRIVE